MSLLLSRRPASSAATCRHSIDQHLTGAGSVSHRHGPGGQHQQQTLRYSIVILVSAVSLYFLLVGVNSSQQSIATFMTGETYSSTTTDSISPPMHQRHRHQLEENDEDEEEEEKEQVGVRGNTPVAQKILQKDHATTRKIVSRNNLLVLDSSSSSLLTHVGCDIGEFSKHDDMSSVRGAGSKRPVVLRDYWKPSDDNWKTEAAFLKAYGRIPYYIKDKYVQIHNDQCVAQFQDLWSFIVGQTSSEEEGASSRNSNSTRRSLLAFTNNMENPALFGKQNNDFQYSIPEPVRHIDSFAILSTMTKGQSHEFHKHGESWIAQAAGHKVWFFLDPKKPRPQKVNACDYLSGKERPPDGTTTCIQSPGDVIWFPHDWYHATCSLTDWNVAIGQQLGPRLDQEFKTLPMTKDNSDRDAVHKTLTQCSDTTSNNKKPKDKAKKPTNDGDNNSISSAIFKPDNWKWYDGDINKYYNDLETDHKRNPNDINDYAVHRWMGPKRSTQIHYELIHESILKHNQKSFTSKKASAKAPSPSLKVLDAGCGLGSALVWMEQNEPSWKLEGRTLSEEQANFIKTKLPPHKFNVELESFDNLPKGVMYDAIYSVEAMIHSTDIQKTLKAWSSHLKDGGTLVIIDDFLMLGAGKDGTEVDLFARSWLANALYTVTEFGNIARRFGLELVESRDLVAEYRIVELNYRNQVPSLDPEQSRNHQGWMGSKYRQKLTVEGKLGYNLLTLRKGVGVSKQNLMMRLSL